MRGIRRRALWLLIIAPVITAGDVRAQSPASASLESYRRARDVLDAAIAAHGGADRIGAIEDVSIVYDGRRHMAYQSFTLARPWNVQPHEWRLVLDLKNSRMRRESIERYPQDFVFRGRQIVTPEGGWWLDPSRAGTGDGIDRFGREAYAGARDGWRREVPAFLLTRARDRAATLRSLGSTTEGGKRYDVLTYTEPDGAQVALYVDATTRLLAKYETLRDDGIVGDQAVAVTFADYRPIAGVQFPARRVELRNGETVREGTLAIAVNTHPHDSVFAAPTGYAERAEVPAEREPIRKLAENVYLLQALPGGNRVLVVGFSDHVLVFETPLPHSAAQAVMDAVKKALPGKPIRYVAFSHHHDDHAAGLRPYIAEGVTIVTTPTNRKLVEQIATARHTIAPDALSRAPRSPVIETFSGKRVFSDGAMTVELHELGSNSHVDEMVLAYLPKERLIFQGDLIILPTQGDVPPANTLTAEFLRKVDAMGWQVETVAGVHGRVGTIKDVRDAVAKRQPAERAGALR